MSSLFEVYDPYTFYLNLSLNWLFILFLLVTSVFNYWINCGTYSQTLALLANFLFSEFSVFLKVKVFKSLIFFFICLFIYIFFVNLFGLLPYVFSVSSHFVFCLSFSLPLWLGLMVIGWVNLTNQMFSHLIPIGTPLLLVSFMVLIETVSQFIRPWSLAIRLMANMISGHLLMSLLGGIEISSLGHFVLLLGQLILFGFEFFVCFVQSYVFCALLVLYYGEV